MCELRQLNRKSIYLVIVFIFIELFTIYFYENKIKILQSIADYKSITIFDMIERNETLQAKNILVTDIVQLVHDYNLKIYSKTFIMKSLCKEWNSNIKGIINIRLHDNQYGKFMHDKYYLTVRDNIVKIDNECKVFK